MTPSPPKKRASARSARKESMVPAGSTPSSKQKPHGGRPTKAAAVARNQRLLEIATSMFMEHGFDATSMDRLAEATAISKATLYARYGDKTALFAAVLRRRILQIYEPLEEEFKDALHGEGDLGTLLRSVGCRLLERDVSPDALTLARILAAQSARFPELGQFAVCEGFLRQVRLVEMILVRFAGSLTYCTDDLELAADLFLSIVLGRAAQTALLGVPVETDRLKHRVEAAVTVFLDGFLRPPSRKDIS
jgi:TetR/AcrR family transcriptional regulator, mexJK operon transcriptional repressor